uniref:Uncharacterized protein n=1 Tax=Arcella intermedia TaxID=1963864 RepID=A0A6B2LEY7_9EUKA
MEVKFRCVGGKGGFGSLLRSSKSTKRTTNFGSCRDIHGRRLRDTDKERLLAELKHQQELREHERIESERARAKEKRLEMDAGLEEVKKAEEEIQSKRKQAVEHVNASVQKAILKKKEEEKKRKREPVEEKNDSESESESQPKLKKQRVAHSESLSPTQTLPSPDNESLQLTQIPRPSIQKEPKEEAVSSPIPSLADEIVDLNTINSLSDLEQFSTETIKRTLIKMGLKCGGTPKDRLNRLWSVKGLAPHMIPSKLKAKGKK